MDDGAERFPRRILLPIDTDTDTDFDFDFDSADFGRLGPYFLLKPLGESW
ncbi:MAG: hypothetical protein QM518_00090 [Verrucomicrobiota bacterium]|nr:hypothetical protein [Verrucomicrobiota bacterium]